MKNNVAGTANMLEISRLLKIKNLFLLAQALFMKEVVSEKLNLMKMIKSIQP